MTDAVAARHWKFWYDFTVDHCMHGYNCIRKQRGDRCDYGQRFKEVHMIGGAVLPVWKVGTGWGWGCPVGWVGCRRPGCRLCGRLVGGVDG